MRPRGAPRRRLADGITPLGHLRERQPRRSTRMLLVGMDFARLARPATTKTDPDVIGLLYATTRASWNWRTGMTRPTCSGSIRTSVPARVPPYPRACDGRECSRRQPL